VRGPFPIELTNVASDTEIPFTYSTQGNPAWISVDSSSNQTPATLKVYLDAAKLLVGEYTTAIEIEADSNDIVNPNLSIPVVVSVESAITTEPDTLLFNYETCEDDPVPRSQPILVTGPIGSEITATVVSSPSNTESVSWAMAELDNEVVPTAVTVTVDPRQRNADFEEAVLLLAEQGTGELRKSVPVYLICANQHLYLPTIDK
jgi:hypothetical protein